MTDSDIERIVSAADPARRAKVPVVKLPQTETYYERMDVVVVWPDEGEKDSRKRSPARSLLYASVICIMAGLLTIGGITIADHATRTTDQRPLSGHHTRSSQPNEIDQYAVDFANFLGDASPQTLTWVSTTDSAAGPVLGNGELNADTPVYVLEISGGTWAGGSWQSTPGKIPSTTEAPATTSTTLNTSIVLVIVVNTESWTAISYGTRPALVDLSSLGTVTTDSLSGITPIPSVTFVQRYHPDR
jgi:hypothetical protein